MLVWHKTGTLSCLDGLIAGTGYNVIIFGGYLYRDFNDFTNLHD